ncbi:Rhodanese-like domain-containing protein 6 [Vitis vinifera]|uniref:Rhodanese-like domain-containing protein 6 n=1 Tax=Vitis vinifera TaxID=29760 RepID=A0A438DUI3_VITVI|nr:Rhodanese-like domain-containing protein 6 [Vitis vinifera]
MADNDGPDQYGVVYTTSTLLFLTSTNSSPSTILTGNSLGLLGRVRLAPDGVNVTIGGKLSLLEKHIAAVKSNSLFEGTDFKLASCHHPLNDQVAKECGFTSLSIRVVKVLIITLYKIVVNFKCRNASSAVEFHSVLQSAGKTTVGERESSNHKKLVLLDARNLYETRIGKFKTPNVETLDPGIRQYSDLPSWIDDNSERFRGNRVLMYCTGGIRCEMASAYIRSKGAGFENVFQLFGGIQRYLEQFPDGGFFKGKNFVFDHRISVGSSDANIMGACLLCGSSFDDYSSRCRCNHCRMLVLVCDSCQQKKDALYVCELCQKHGKGYGSIPLIENDESQVITQPIKLKTVPSDDTTLSPQIHSRHGKVPSLPENSESCACTGFGRMPLPTPANCRKKFAWLVSPDFSGASESNWKKSDGQFDPLQYQQQTDGFDVSLAYLKTVFSQAGPFDGIMGFSQGAAMAAAVSARRGRPGGEMDFRFVILCSGFALNLPDSVGGSINCPSLHIFGNEQGNDRQIANQASRDLAASFEEGCSVIIEHDSGHMIPTRSPYIDEIRDFLHRFL